MDIANRTILITGASRGIGRALLDEALRRGARRVYAGIRSEPQSTDARVTPVLLDVTSARQIERAVRDVASVDILINNAGIALGGALGDPGQIEQHMAVNLLGPLNMTLALQPLLERSRGAVVNILSLAALAPVPLLPAYSISKAAAFNLTQSLRMLLAGRGISVHGAVLGPIDTDMTRGLDVPKSSAQTAARGILDGLERGEEDIFPDPASMGIADAWRAGVAKALEQQFAAFVPQAAMA